MLIIMVEVAAAIIEDGGKILIARRKKGQHMEGMWEFPGGKIELGETAPECLMRELKEELEIVVEVGDFVGESIYDYNCKTIKLLAYKAKYISGHIKLNEHSEIKWIGLDETEKFEFAPADIPLLEKYKINQ